MRQGMRTESRQIDGVQVEIRFPEYPEDHNRPGGQVVTVIVARHEERPLRYVVGHSQLPEGVDPDTEEGQDAALKLKWSQIEADVRTVLRGRDVSAQDVPL